MTLAAALRTFAGMRRNESLMTWQWAHYPSGHRARRNLLLHLLTVPLFQAGTVALVAAPWRSGWLALAGLVAIALAMAAQGRGHRGEATAPLPFAGPLDAIARILVEQWVTFPRYLLSGRFAQAWRRRSASDAPAAPVA
jgi:hypothetical protein